MSRAFMAYGIEGEGGRLLVARALRTKGGVRSELVYDSSTAPASEGASPLARLEQGGVQIAGSLGVRQSVCRWIEVPLASVRKARKVLDSQLDLVLPFPVEQALCSFPCLERLPSGAGLRALAVAAKATAVDERLAFFQEHGVDVHRLDHEALAVWDRAVRQHPLDADVWRVVAYVAADRGFLVFGRGRQPQAIHALPEPGNLAQWSFRARSVAEALRSGGAQEARVEWLWIGPSAGSVQTGPLEKALPDTLSIRFTRAEQPEAFLACALAERCLAASPLPCNLRVGERSHPAVERERHRSLRGVALLWLVFSAAILGVSLGGLAVLGSREARIDRALQQTARELAGPMVPVPRGQEVLMAERALEGLVESGEAFRRVYEPRETRLLLGLVLLLASGGMDLQSFSLGEGTLAIAGTAPSWDHCSFVRDWLEQQGYTASLDRQEAGADERVHFSIRGGLGE